MINTTNLVLFSVLLAGAMYTSSRVSIDRSFDITGWKGNTLSAQSTKIIKLMQVKQVAIKARAYFSSIKDENRFRKLIQLYTEGERISRFLDPNVDALQLVQIK